MLYKKLLVIFTGVLLLWSCGNKTGKLDKKYMHTEPEFANYISGYTSGVISKNTQVKVKLAQRIDSLPKEVFTFEPFIKGNAILEKDNRTIIFQPEEELAANQVYLTTLDLEKINSDVPDNLKKFQFQFQVIKQDFTYEIKGMKPISTTDLKWNTVSGEVYTADDLEIEKLNKFLVVNQGGKELPVAWEKVNGKTSFAFKIKDVQRKNKDEKIQLFFDKDVIGVDKSQKISYEIPSFSNFKVLNINAISGKQQMVSILFSDPIKKQDLKGLIEFENNNPKIKNFEIRDNEIIVYPKNVENNKVVLKIHKGIRNKANFKLKKGSQKEVIFNAQKPEIKLVGTGNIIPSSNELLFPFESTGLKGVHVKIFKIYEDNVIQFFQENEYNGSHRLREVGAPVFEQDIQLTSSKGINLNERNKFSLDLAKFIKPDPGAIYRVQLSMKPHLSNYGCLKEDNLTELEIKKEEDWLDNEYHDEYEDFDYFYPENYSWKERDNPCNVSYYTGRRTVSRNVIASNFGMIAKLTGNKKLDVTITDLLTTNPLENIQIKVYDYQQQLINESFTDENGFVQIPLNKKPFLVVAEKNKEKGYLKITNGNALNISQFNVGGVIPKSGIKGYIYGERGVWRPGDNIHLTCVFQNNLNKIPNNYPLTLEFYSPDNQLFDKKISNKGVNGFYTFTLNTPPDAPTGNWYVVAKAGNYTVRKNIKVETIKPNKLKIKLDFDKEIITKVENKVNLHAEWLHGAVAKGLKANMTATLFQTQTKFKAFENYNFEDPTKEFKSEEIILYDRAINEKGDATIPLDFNFSSLPSGYLNIGFFTKVFEKGGDFSTNYQKKTYSPYSSYVGMNFKYSDNDWEMLVTDKNHKLNIATVNQDGKPILNKELKISVYRLNQRWWYSEDDDKEDYTSSSYSKLISSDYIETNENGVAVYNFNVNHDDWGRYFVRIEDLKSRHSVGQVLYVDWPDWRSRGSVGDDAAILNFKPDKEKYKVGDVAEITIPSYKNGRALLSLETGTSIIGKKWIETKAGKTKIKINITPDMVPNVYANITLIQPHAQTKNDLPIRLFGIAPILVEDPKSHLKPIIKAPKVLSPEKNYTVTVSEKNDQEMTYTLAVVDEGLLDITSYRTPDIWNYFNRKEALGIRTWDAYSAVLGAFNGTFSNIFAIGGGDQGLAAINKGKINRFKPVVSFLGPFELKKGAKGTHKLKLPNYIGRIKVMIVAGNQDNQFGNAEKSIEVKQPLMVSSTLPRVLSPGEKINFPITLFSDPNLKSAKITITSNGLLKIGETNKIVDLSEDSETITTIPIVVANKTGVAKLKINVESGRYKTHEELDVAIRIPNPPIVKAQRTVLEGSGEETLSYVPFGVEGTRSVKLNVSTLPHIDLDKRLDYLIQYPHGCVEQTTSSVFPQLYLTTLIDLSKKEQSKIEENIKAGITRLKTFQLTNGGLGYWPDSSMANDWGTNYAGNFMIEAERKGYALPVGFKSNWISYQKMRANRWNNSISSNRYDRLGDHQLIQAYRLYTLALATSPNLGAMNRLREEDNLQPQAAWRLAAAYALVGKKEVANQILSQNIQTNIDYDKAYSNTYGSKERDWAMKLETYALLDNSMLGVSLMNQLAGALSSSEWMSTQTTAYSLIAISKFATKGTIPTFNFSYAINGKIKDFHSDKARQKEIVLEPNGGKVLIQNKGQGRLFVTLVNKGTPLNEKIESSNENLQMRVVYKTLDDVSLNPDNIKQGTDFKVEVTLTNPNTLGDYKNLALSQIFPSGWEIINTRVNDQVSVHTKDKATYQDIKDDRVYTYFDLRKGKTKTFVTLLNAAYKGTYILPAITCEAMYNDDVKAIKENGKVQVD